MTQKEINSAVEVMLTIAKMARKPIVTRRAMGLINEFKESYASKVSPKKDAKK